MSLGERLKTLRGESTQADFAALLGLSKNTYSRYERGTRIPDADFLKMVCRKLQANPSWLLLGEGHMKGVSALGAPDLAPVGVRVTPDKGLLRIDTEESADLIDKAYDAATFVAVEAPDFITAAEPAISTERQRIIYRIMIELLARVQRQELTVIHQVLAKWLQTSLSDG